MTADLDTGPGWGSIGAGTTVKQQEAQTDPDLHRPSLTEDGARIDRIWSRVTGRSPAGGSMTPSDFLRFHSQLCQIVFQAPVDPGQARRLGLHDLVSATGRYERPVPKGAFARFLTSVAVSWSSLWAASCTDLLDQIDQHLAAAPTIVSIEGAKPIELFRYCQSLAEAGQYVGAGGTGELSRSAPAPDRATRGWVRLRTWIRKAIPRILSRWPSTRVPTTIAAAEQLTAPRSVTLLVEAAASTNSSSESVTRRSWSRSLPEILASPVRKPLMPPRSTSVVTEKESAMACAAARRTEAQLYAVVSGRRQIEALLGHVQVSSDSDDQQNGDLNPNFTNNEFVSDDTDLSSSSSMVERRKRHRRRLLRMKARADAKAVTRAWPRPHDPTPRRIACQSESESGTPRRRQPMCQGGGAD